ncbi:MAG: POT family MFS transporter [Anaeromyxobacter sp.]
MASDRYPPQIKYIVGNEACERFSFYGVSSILVLYMGQFLLYGKQEATAIYHLFVAVSYLTPMVGGYVADRLTGRYAVILYVSLAYVLGHAVLALWETRVGLWVGLLLIAAGAGGIKPCVSAFVGDQFPPDRKRLLERVYGWFYWIINLGSASAKSLIPWLMKDHGPAMAFAPPGIAMALAVVVFWVGRRHYVRTPPSGPNPHAFLKVTFHALRRAGTGRAGEHWLDVARDQHPADAVEGAKSVYRLLGIFAAVTLFWSLFDQKSSRWVQQAQQMDLTFFGREVSPAQIQVMNPLLVMALIPLFTWGVFPLLERWGVRLTPLRKMTAGMFVTVLSFVASATVQTLLDGGQQLHALWQAPQYLLLTSAEVLVSVTGLEFAYTQAPRAMRSTIMSFWFLTVFLGNLLVSALNLLLRLDGAPYYWVFAVLMLLAALAFQWVARRYRPVEAPAPTPAAAGSSGTPST